MKIQQYPAIACFTALHIRRIDMIVVHATAGVKAGDLYTLSGRDPRHRVSTHYYVTKLGDVYQLVQDKDIAWHAGISFWQGETDCNQFSIGIEIENLNDGLDHYPLVQLRAVEHLVQAKVMQYHIRKSRVVQHRQIALPAGRKSDPRAYPWDQLMAAVYPFDVAREPGWYVVRENETRVREAPTTASAVAWGGTAKMPEGREVEIVEIKAGQNVALVVDGQLVTSNLWGRWMEAGRSNGWIWMGLLIPRLAVL